MSRPWRVGRSLGRTLYIQNGGDPKEDTFVGVMDTRELAVTVVASINALDDALAARADLRAKVEALPGNDPFQSPERRDAYEYAITQVLDLIDGSSDD